MQSDEFWPSLVSTKLSPLWRKQPFVFLHPCFSSLTHNPLVNTLICLLLLWTGFSLRVKFKKKRCKRGWHDGSVDDLSSSQTLLVGGENWLPNTVLWLPHICHGMHTVYTHAYIYKISKCLKGKINKINVGWQNFPMGHSPCYQPWWLKFHPWYSHRDRRREAAPASRPLATHTPWHVQAPHKLIDCNLFYKMCHKFSIKIGY